MDKYSNIENVSNYIGDIIRIFEDCDCIQHSGESEYTKKYAKINAYDELYSLLVEGEEYEIS